MDHHHDKDGDDADDADDNDDGYDDDVNDDNDDGDNDGYAANMNMSFKMKSLFCLGLTGIFIFRFSEYFIKF